jgi:hypothetical protein
MRVALALVLNAALLALLLPWLRRQWVWAATGWWRAGLVGGLVGRFIVAVFNGLHLTPDGARMSYYGHELTSRFWAAPASWPGLLTTGELGAGTGRIYFQGTSNTLLFSKLLAVFNLASLDTDWLNGLYLSLFAFGACWYLVRKLAVVFPVTNAAVAGLLAFIVWPSVIYWASGIVKDTLVLGSGAWFLAEVLGLAYTSGSVAQRIGAVGRLLLSAGLHFAMRYFFAVPLLGGAAVLAMLLMLKRMGLRPAKLTQAVLAALLLTGGAYAASEVSIVFRLNKFTSQLMYMRTQGLKTSRGKTIFIDYPDLRPTNESILQHVPRAALNAIARPWLGESREIKFVAASLENTVIIGLLLLAGWSVWRHRAGKLPFEFVLALSIQCLALAVLMGLSTANLGSLHRYRSVMLPYLLLLLLQNDYVAAGLRRLRLAARHVLAASAKHPAKA